MTDTEKKEAILSEITTFYLSSGDYNGIPVRNLTQQYDIEKIRELITSLLNESLVCIVYGDYHPNPHIKALDSEPVAEQLEKLTTDRFNHACVYPTTNHLSTIVNSNDYEGRPFELRLAMGEPQLSFLNFDLAVLEIYRNDPRYYYKYNDTYGYISITDEYFEKDNIPESDQILLETFGISFDKDDNAYVAAFLRFLSNLSPEHQQIWNAKRVDVDAHLHPNYYRSSILGEWPERVSLYEAVLMEMSAINDISNAIGRPDFFRKDFSGENRPRDFGYLLRSTQKEFNDFIHLLDKMLSENINRDFFQGEVAMEREEARPDGKIQIKPKGSLQIMEEWIRNSFHTDHWDDIEEMFKTLRKIRKLRQKPAHSVRENTFDQSFFKEQGQLMKDLYRAVKVIRSILHLHPKASSVQIDEHLEEGLIWAV